MLPLVLHTTLHRMVWVQQDCRGSSVLINGWSAAWRIEESWSILCTNERLFPQWTQTCPHSLISNEVGLFIRGQSGWNVKVTIRLYLVLIFFYPSIFMWCLKVLKLRCERLGETRENVWTLVKMENPSHIWKTRYLWYKGKNQHQFYKFPILARSSFR